MSFLVLHSTFNVYQLIGPLHDKLNIKIDMFLNKINIDNAGDDNPSTYSHLLTLISQWP